MGHMEGKCLHVTAHPGKCFHPSGFCECGWLEGNSEVLEEAWRSACREVMADETEVR